MRYIIATPDVVIPLGRQGEDNVETVQFDVSGWPEEYGEGAYELLHERCMDTAPYECPITVADGVLSWVVRSADTAYVGRGEAQLMYVVNDGVAKSVIYKTSTLRSIDGDPDFPDPYDDWLRQMHEDAEFCRENMADALAAKEDAEAWAVGTRNGEPVDEDDPTYHNSSLHHAQQSGAYASAAGDSADAAAQSATQAAAYVGSPLVATLVSEMTDHTKVYVYVGEEAGMTSGHWYYYDGSDWADGGVYNSIADDVATNADIDALIFS